jgi:type II secretory pathway pseudopilin PulG
MVERSEALGQLGTVAILALLTFQTAVLSGPFVFGLDDRPQFPIGHDAQVGIGNGAEDPFGLVGAPILVGPSPSLLTVAHVSNPLPLFRTLSDADILVPGVTGPEVNTVPPEVNPAPPLDTTYIDEFSSNRAPIHGRPLRLAFSVDRASKGVHESAVRDQFDHNQQPGDLFLSDGLFTAPSVFLPVLPPGVGYFGDLVGVGSGTTNSLLLNQSALTLRAGSPIFVDSTVTAPDISPGSHDNVDGFDIALVDTTDDDIGDKHLYFSVNPSQPGLNPIYTSAAAIYRTAPGSQFPAQFAIAPTMGLDGNGQNTDDIDGLELFDRGAIGVLNPGVDYALFSLSPGSQTLLNNPGLTAADIFFTDFDHSFARFVRDADLGLSGTVNPAELGGPGGSPGAGPPVLEPDGNDNLDALGSYTPGDMDWNGELDLEDVDDFVQGLTRPEEYDDEIDHFFYPATTLGDFSPFDFIVDFDDVPPFRLAIEAVIGPVAGQSIPEPGAFPLVAMALIVLASKRAVRGVNRGNVQALKPAAQASELVSGLRCGRSTKVFRRTAYTIVELLVVITIISVLLAMLLPAIQSAREAARSAQCADHLKQLALATQAYHSSHNQFPTGSTLPSHPNASGNSWLLYCLPYLEEREVADRILKQREAIAPPIPLFFCPSDEIVIGSATQLHVTSYCASGGAGMSPEHVIDLEDKICGDVYTDGIFYPLSKTAAKTITDGLTHTLAIGERTYFKHIWTEGAFWVGSADQRLCIQSSKNVRWPINSPAATSGYCVADKEAPPSLRTLRMNDLYFGSRHPGGAWFAFAGGNVHFIADDIAFSVYQDLATRNNGESSPSAGGL